MFVCEVTSIKLQKITLIFIQVSFKQNYIWKYFLLGSKNHNVAALEIKNPKMLVKISLRQCEINMAAFTTDMT